MKQKINKIGFEPTLKAKYLVILALLGVLSIMAPSFIMEYSLWAFYVTVGFVALVVFGLYTHVRFQKLHRILRPFIVVRILQALTTIAFLALLYSTFGMIQAAPLPYLVFLSLSFVTVYQFYNIFLLAAQAKKDYPDRCEFC